MPHKVRIALDAMGGDHGAAVVVPGAELLLTRRPDIEFLLFGDRAVVEPLVDARPRLKAVARLIHTDVAVKMDAKPSQALRQGRWSKLPVALPKSASISAPRASKASSRWWSALPSAIPRC